MNDDFFIELPILINSTIDFDEFDDIDPEDLEEMMFNKMEEHPNSPEIEKAMINKHLIIGFMSFNETQSVLAMVGDIDYIIDLPYQILKEVLLQKE